jgi:hypothetical protein
VARATESRATGPEDDAAALHHTSRSSGDAAPKTDEEPQPRTKPGKCVVDDGTGHYADGRVIPGAEICSAHEMHYFRDGTRRG